MSEELPLAVVMPSRKKRGGYPTYSTEYGEEFGFNIRARQNMYRAGYKNGFDLNPLNPTLNHLEFVVPLHRRDSLGFRRQYPERLPQREPLSQTPHLLFPPTAPRQPISQGKYKVDMLHRNRVAPQSKFIHYPWNVPPSEFDIYRYPTRELVEQQRQMQQQQQQQRSRQATPARQATPVRQSTPLQQSRQPTPAAQPAKLNGLTMPGKPLSNTYMVY